jgi:deoxyribodipyrimidine photo-lyase
MNIFLFHRDLRLPDNTTLIKQIKEEKSVTPIFIFPPEQINPKINKYFSNNSVQFMIESLHELSQSIKEKNGKMYFFKGDTLKVLKSIHKKIVINSIGYNLDYTPYAKQRDKSIREWSKDNNIKCYEEEDYALFNIIDGTTQKDNGEPYLVYTPFKNNCMKNLEVREVDKFRSFDFTKYQELDKNSYNINEKDIDDFYKDNENINVHGGRINGLKILLNMGKFKDYEKKRDFLTYKTTFLGAHNHFTTVSIREVYYAMLNKLGKNSGLIRELIWRDFYLNITHYFPRVLHGQISNKNKSYRELYDNIKWSYNKNKFEKWCSGETGFPIIDAAMKQLNTTGFMHNRARMIVANFLIKDLHIDWRWGEQYFATKLVDYDPASNSGGWQWSGGNGTDAQPYFRIFNPWSQAEKFDPDCIYIKKWLPELETIPNEDIKKWYKDNIHKKWLNEGINYFKPIIEHDKERMETLKIYKKALK